MKRIVEEHRGTIEASSDKSGIRVRVILPVIASSSDHAGALPDGQDLGHGDTVGGST